MKCLSVSITSISVTDLTRKEVAKEIVTLVQKELPVNPQTCSQCGKRKKMFYCGKKIFFKQSRF